MYHTHRLLLSFVYYLVLKLSKDFIQKFSTKLKNLQAIHIQGLLKLRKLQKDGLNIISNLNLKEFDRLLIGKTEYESDCKWLLYGFPLWLKSYFNSNIDLNKLSTKVLNHVNSPEQALAILDKFIAEGKKGQIIAYTGIIKYCLSVHCVPKKDAKGNYTLFRVVRNASYHESGFISLNSIIRKSKCKMPSLPNLKEYAKLFLSNSFAAIRDLSDAFRQIPLYKPDQEYIVYSLFGLIFKDCFQPYGVSSAASNCQYFVSLLVWILDNKIFDPQNKHKTLVHIDDFVLCASSKSECQKMERQFDQLMHILGVILSKKQDSYVHARSDIIAYGIHWNLSTKRCSIPDKKMQRFIQYLLLSMQYRVVTGSVLDYICGNILYFGQLNPLAKCLAWKLMKYIYQNIRSGKFNKYKIYILPLNIIYEFKFWITYPQLVKNIPISEIISIPYSNTIYGFTDASNLSAGWIIGSKWSLYDFDSSHFVNDESHINQKELHCVLSAIYTLKSELSGRKLHLYIDNSVTVSAIANKWSSNFNIMIFIYELCHILIKYKIFIYVEWISSATNILSDSLSRHKLDIFWNHVNLFHLIVDDFPTNTIIYNDFNYTNNFISKDYSIQSEYNDFIKFVNLPLSIRKYSKYHNYAKNFQLYNLQ